MNKIRILFDSYHLYHLPQFEPLIDLLSNDKRFNIYHSVSRDIKNIELKDYMHHQRFVNTLKNIKRNWLIGVSYYQV